MRIVSQQRIVSVFLTSFKANRTTLFAIELLKVKGGRLCRKISYLTLDTKFAGKYFVRQFNNKAIHEILNVRYEVSLKH